MFAFKSFLPNQDQKNDSGFILIELCIALMIISLMLAAYLPYARMKDMRERIEKTNENMAIVQESLKKFWDEHQRYPCPASPTISKDGKKSLTETACSDSISTSSGIKKGRGYERRNVSIGYIPTKTLGLPERFSIDGWYTPFTYVISTDLTKNQIMQSKQNYKKAAINLIDENNELVIDPPPLYLLVSSGPNQSGLQPDICSQYKYEKENCDSNGTYIKAPYSEADKDHYFDDVIVHDRDILYFGEAQSKKTFEGLLACQHKGSFYNPGDPDADDEGCINRAIPTGVCGEGMVFKGSDSSGQIICTPNMQPGFCRGGDTPLGYDENGKIICSDLISKFLICSQQGLLYAGKGTAGADENGCKKTQQ